MDWSSWIEEDVWTTAEPPAQAAAPNAPETSNAAVTKERKLKCSSIIDQGDDSEVIVLPEEKRKMWLQHYIQLMGFLAGGGTVERTSQEGHQA